MREIEVKNFACLLVVLLALTFVPGISASRAALPEGEKQAAQVTENKDGERVIHLDTWLLLGPIRHLFPAFHDEEKQDNDAAFILSLKDMDPASFIPKAGDRIGTFEKPPLEWTAVRSDSTGVLLSRKGKDPAVAWLAAWIDAPRWMKIGIEASSTDPFEIFLDGASVIKCTKGTGTGNPGEKQNGSVKIGQGKHLLTAKTVCVPGDSIVDWRLDANVKISGDFRETPSIGLDPSMDLNISHILDVPNIRSIAVSPDGKMALISYWRFIPPDGTRESWMEIRNLPDGTLARTLDPAEMRNVGWAPSGRRLSFAAGSGKTNSIRILDLDTEAVETVVDGIADLGGYTWSPDGSFVVFYTDQNYKDDGSGIKRLRNIGDRTEYGRNRSSVFIASVPGGMVRKLATGKFDSFVSDISPDGRKLLLSRAYEDLSERPFGKSELVLLDLDDMSTRLLQRGRWLGNAAWSPTGEKILVEGGPSTFGAVGRDVPDGVIPNDYDGQLYILDPATAEVEAITKKFDPSVRMAVWSKADGNIYIVAEKGAFIRLFRYDVKRKTFTELDTGVDVISASSGGILADISRTSPVCVFAGSGADRPERIFSIDLRKGKATEIAWPGRELLGNVVLGTTEDFDFVSEEGRTITGIIKYPPDFDPAKKYPCIVYYYGGTSPVDRSFGGRYPKNLWTAHGYIVYVLQPSGATGFGQEFSALHVNDWGRTTAAEVIYGTKKLLESHPFINPYRVGCIGASYGGFMTQLIITRTDLFAAAVSHAGISMISSYWGEGYWGYGYNAVAAAESFPWNRKDIYVDQSPLFAADRIVTPLLLLHGASDTNVPPGESEQMYTALKLLGREIEYIKYSGQDHFILDYKKRIAWSDAQLAWFDKWLKDQPEWWDDMYPPIEQPVKRSPEKIGVVKAVLEEDQSVLFGEVTREDIVSAIDGWDREFNEYTPDAQLMPSLEEYIYGVDITCVLGTWCPDSQREIPRLWKILEGLKYPLSEIKMFAVGSSRFSAGTPAPARAIAWSRKVREFYGVQRVATIIVSKDGKELGRIVETPGESLEKDLLKILSSK